MPALFQESELIGLIMAIPLMVVSIILCRRVIARFMIVILISGIFTLGAMIFTVVEGIILSSFFNYLEHICYAIAGLLLGTGCILAWQSGIHSKEIF